MNRRDTLKKLILTSGGLITLPAWANGWTISDLTIHHTSYSILEQDILASVADTIIPAGNSIGALSVGVDKYLQRLIEKCHTKDIQDNVMHQLNSLDASAQTAYGKSFASCDQVQRQELLVKLSTSEQQEEKDFFNLMKSETIRGFNTSKEVMTDYLRYKIFPAHYYGCVEVKV
ncbi:MAG: gluconate 2-dehydrogenase subunit 3 family protein [Bacteroidia bacterium]|nr:gluconate 2-dehydrogenase subunit 3 family protein [Bacteroidia bacterium]